MGERGRKPSAGMSGPLRLGEKRSREVLKDGSVQRREAVGFSPVITASQLTGQTPGNHIND